MTNNIKWDDFNSKEIEDKYVYRYLSIDKLIDFLKTGSLYLSRLDRFEDNLEGISPYRIIEILYGVKGSTKPENPNPNISEPIWKELISKSKSAVISEFSNLVSEQKNTFVSCWILGDVESIGMWDLYGKRGFALRFEINEFIELVKKSINNQNIDNCNIDTLVAGKVVYQNYDRMIYNEVKSKLRYSVFRKHLSFQHECEYRLVGFMENNSDIMGMKYQLGNINNLNFDIIANPRFSEMEMSIYRDVLNKYTKNDLLKESKLKIWLKLRDMKFSN